MNSARDNCEDLIVRAKRGGLSESEQRQFRELLDSSSEARLLYEAGCAFDRESHVMPGDEARLERIAHRMQKRRLLRQRPMPIRALSLGVVAAVLVAGVAVGAVNYSRLWRARSARSSPAMTAATRSSTAATTRSSNGVSSAFPVESNPRESRAPAPALPAPSAQLRNETQPLPLLQALPAPIAQLRNEPQLLQTAPAPARAILETSQPLSPTSVATGRFDDELQVPKQEASTLFTDANRARVRGDAALAAAQYERLIGQFPRSREAFGARLSLGMLYLQQGQPRQALVQFETYRATSGPLLAEALWGEAQALRSLEQIQNERRTLERIVREYPHSAYASSAQSRLSQIE